MIIKTPATHFFTSGWGEAPSARNALDSAFFAARLGNVSPFRVGPVIPPGSRLVEGHELPLGALVPVIYACLSSAVPGELISAGVAVAYPHDRSQGGLIMEYAAPGHKEDIEAVVRRMAEEGLKLRGQTAEDILSIAVQHKVEKTGAVLAAVVLWD